MNIFLVDDFGRVVHLGYRYNHPFWLVGAHLTQAAALSAPAENEVI
jgi:hypothetical protein